MLDYVKLLFIVFFFLVPSAIYSCGKTKKADPAKYTLGAIPEQVTVGLWTYQLEASCVKGTNGWDITAKVFDADNKYVGSGFTLVVLSIDNGHSVSESIPSTLPYGSPYKSVSCQAANVLGLVGGQGIDVILELHDIGLPSFQIRAPRIIIPSNS